MISAARFTTAVAPATVAGCVGPSREDVLEHLVGQEIEPAIEAFGPPGSTRAPLLRLAPGKSADAE
jgi:hypothetical protein